MIDESGNYSNWNIENFWFISLWYKIFINWYLFFIFYIIRFLPSSRILFFQYSNSQILSFLFIFSFDHCMTDEISSLKFVLFLTSLLLIVVTYSHLDLHETKYIKFNLMSDDSNICIVKVIMHYIWEVTWQHWKVLSVTALFDEITFIFLITMRLFISQQKMEQFHWKKWHAILEITEFFLMFVYKLTKICVKTRF